MYGEGVMRGYGSELAVTGTSSPIAVAAGAANVYGSPYENTASVNVTVPTPVVGTTGHRIVLRKSWAAQTTRITLISSSDGVASIPAATQTAGTTWDLTLATLTITTGGVITRTDARTYAQYQTNHVKRDGDTMTGALAVASTLSATGAASLSSTLAVTGATTLNSTLAVTGNITHGGATVWDSGNDGNNSGLDADLLKGMDIETLSRQGGSATVWSTTGTTTYSPTAFKIQVGSVNVSGGNFVVTFPVAFTQAPLIFTQADLSTSAAAGVAIEGLTSTTFTVTLYNVSTGSATTGTMYWMAIGPV